MQNYLEGWLIVWMPLFVAGLSAILFDEGVPDDRSARILLPIVVGIAAAYLAIPFASFGALFLATLG